MYFKFHWSEKTLCAERQLKYVIEARINVKFEASRVSRLQSKFKINMEN